MPQSTAPDFKDLIQALILAGFRGDIDSDSALLAAMSTDNSVYQIFPDLIVAPRDAQDAQTVIAVLDRPEFSELPLTGRGGGTGTNGQSLNRGVIVDMRRHMNRLLQVNAAEAWAEVEPGMVLDDLNDQLRPLGLFFAPETSTSTRCTIGGMVSTDASGKGSRIYGKTSDNILGLEIAHPSGLLDSDAPAPVWARPVLALAEAASRQGRSAFIDATPRLNRRFTGYDLERACPDSARFDWFRLFLGAEGTLGLITRIRVKLLPLPAHKRLIVAGFDSFKQALAAATPLLEDEPTAIEVMDEWVASMAHSAGILTRLPAALHPAQDTPLAYVFIEFNGDDTQTLDHRLQSCRQRLASLDGSGAVHLADQPAEIRELWAIRSAGVGLLGKVDGPARPIAFVEDCVVPPENLPAFIDEFLALLTEHGLGFGIYGHVDVGCLHIRPALNIDSTLDRDKLVAVSDAVFALTRKYDGIFWGEHGKGVRGAYLQDWIGPKAYAALQGVKAAFDPKGRYNPGKLVSNHDAIMGIGTTNFRPFNSPQGDPLERAFRCNGNAQCLSYAATTPMCPSFKASADLRHSPKGRADALRAWRMGQTTGQRIDESELLGVLDSCLGCKACASTCPVQVDIPQMRSAFYADYYGRNRRPLADRLTLMAERLSPLTLRFAPIIRPFWPVIRRMAEGLMAANDLPDRLAPAMPRHLRITRRELRETLAPATVLIAQDWFTAQFDAKVQTEVADGLTALGYHPRFLPMLPAGKAALNLGDMAGFDAMAQQLRAVLSDAAASGAPIIGLDPAFVMMLRQDYPRSLPMPQVLLPQEFLTAQIATGRAMPKARRTPAGRLLSHCTETTGQPDAPAQWAQVFAAMGARLDTPATGCCGMAGLFGHQKRHQPASRKLFDMSWRSQLDHDGPVMATGFSCRCQGERLTDSHMRHPLGVIADMLA